MSREDRRTCFPHKRVRFTLHSRNGTMIGRGAISVLESWVSGRQKEGLHFLDTAIRDWVEPWSWKLESIDDDYTVENERYEKRSPRCEGKRGENCDVSIRSERCGPKLPTVGGSEQGEGEICMYCKKED